MYDQAKEAIIKYNNYGYNGTNYFKWILSSSLEDNNNNNSYPILILKDKFSIHLYIIFQVNKYTCCSVLSN